MKEPISVDRLFAELHTMVCMSSRQYLDNGLNNILVQFYSSSPPEHLYEGVYRWTEKGQFKEHRYFELVNVHNVPEAIMAAKKFQEALNSIESGWYIRQIYLAGMGRDGSISGYLSGYLCLAPYKQDGEHDINDISESIVWHDLTFFDERENPPDDEMHKWAVDAKTTDEISWWNYSISTTRPFKSVACDELYRRVDKFSLNLGVFQEWELRAKAKFEDLKAQWQYIEDELKALVMRETGLPFDY